jgi:hypothetical protein
MCSRQRFAGVLPLEYGKIVTHKGILPEVSAFESGRRTCTCPVVNHNNLPLQHRLANIFCKSYPTFATNLASGSCKACLVWRVLENHFQSASPSAARMLICTSRSRAHSLLRDKYYMIHRRHGRGYSTPCSPKRADRSPTQAVSSALHHSHRTGSFSTRTAEHIIIPASYRIITTTSPSHRTYRHTTTPLAIFMPHTGKQQRLLLHSQPLLYQSTGRLNSITPT